MKRTTISPISSCKMIRNRASSRGMSLVEVLVAILIFAIGALSLLSMTTSSFRFNSDSLAVDESVNLARLNMDRLLSLDYTDGQLQDTNADGAAGLLAADVASADHGVVSGRYSVWWNIAGDIPFNGTKTIAVIVKWKGLDRDRQVVFQTIKAE